MLGLNLTDSLCRELAPPVQVWRAPVHIMGIGCEKMDTSLVEHSLGPVSRISTKSASEGARGYLHPTSGMNQSLDQQILRLDPG